MERRAARRLDALVEEIVRELAPARARDPPRIPRDEP
jgi:hypothetical protein